MKVRGILGKNKVEDAIRASTLELERYGIIPKERLLFRLTFEEILLLFTDASPEGTIFSVRTKKKGDKFFIILSIPGNEINPLQMESKLLERLLNDPEKRPEYDYLDGKNTVTFRFTLYNTAGSNYAFAWQYVKENKKTLYFAVFIQLISVFLGVVAPVLSARIIYRYMSDQAVAAIVVAGILLTVQLIKNVLMVQSNKGYNQVYCKTVSVLEKDLVKGVLNIKTGCIDEKGSGMFVQRLTGDTTRMATGFGRIADMAAQAVNYIGILLAMLYINFKVFFLALILLVCESLIEIYRTKKLYQDDRVYRNANDRFSGFIGELVRGARDVKQLGSEEAFCREAEERVVNANDKRYVMQTNSWTLKLVRWEFSEVGTFLFITAMAVFMMRGWLMAPTVVVLYNLFSSLDVRAITLAGEFMEYVKDFNLSVERVCAIMNSPEFPRDQYGDRKLKDPKGEIVFENVTFSYPSENPQLKKRKILDDMDMTIHPGEMVALVGKSGCGKTTVLNLLSRLYDQQKGKILLDGEDIRTLSKETIRSAMTIVNQSPYIFNMSVRENLQLCKEDMTEEEMIRVCTLACIDDDIRKMPKGYDTIIGEGGVNLSGGQRQRLAIARSLLRDFRIILFDEATSALDNVTQTRIQDAINAIKKDRTVLIIAHRLSTVINADRILYMSDGHIIGEGRHEELLKTCEPYRLLYKEGTEQNKERDNERGVQ